jgi:hypothetical protein
MAPAPELHAIEINSFCVKISKQKKVGFLKIIVALQLQSHQRRARVLHKDEF